MVSGQLPSRKIAPGLALGLGLELDWGQFSSETVGPETFFTLFIFWLFYTFLLNEFFLKNTKLLWRHVFK